MLKLLIKYQSIKVNYLRHCQNVKAKRLVRSGPVRSNNLYSSDKKTSILMSYLLVKFNNLKLN